MLALSDVLLTTPLGFVVGVLVGIVLAQRGYRITRRNGVDRDA